MESGCSYRFGTILPDDGKGQNIWAGCNDTYLPLVPHPPGRFCGRLTTASLRPTRTFKRLSKFVGRPDDAGDVPTGSDFALLIGAGSPHLFFQAQI